MSKFKVKFTDPANKKKFHITYVSKGEAEAKMAQLKRDGVKEIEIVQEDLDRQPQDFEDLGVFFSPTTEINEDIVYQLGSFRLDDYIGSPLPSAQTASVYKDLKALRYKNNDKFDWHADYDKGRESINKLTCLIQLSDESEFEGGELELCGEGNVAPLTQGHAIFFASFLNHRVKPVTKGVRKSLVVWFGGTPFK